MGPILWPVVWEPFKGSFGAVLWTYYMPQEALRLRVLLLEFFSNDMLGYVDVLRGCLASFVGYFLVYL